MRSSVDHGTAFDIAGTGKGGYRQYAGVDAGGGPLLENEASIIAEVHANHEDREMEKHLLISKGCKGWGGPLTITPVREKDCVHHRGSVPGRRPPERTDRLAFH